MKKLLAILIVTLVACDYHGKEHIKPQRDPTRTEAETLLRQKLVASGVSQNPTIVPIPCV